MDRAETLIEEAIDAALGGLGTLDESDTSSSRSCAFRLSRRGSRIEPERRIETYRRERTRQERASVQEGQDR